ncbi:MAG: hypothetical protein KJZ74_02115 [Gemmatimonadales bacterium]|nr:hypothetical protein [Gemmatimonadota bacterium]MCL4212687.1 hypothetical protein [Gemmatimonadales bacterium]
MARKPNYNYEKRRKEMDRAAKKKARKEEREARKEEGATDAVPIEASETLGALPLPGAKPGVIFDAENAQIAE